MIATLTTVEHMNCAHHSFPFSHHPSLPNQMNGEIERTQTNERKIYWRVFRQVNGWEWQRQGRLAARHQEAKSIISANNKSLLAYNFPIEDNVRTHSLAFKLKFVVLSGIHIYMCACRWVTEGLSVCLSVCVGFKGATMSAKYKIEFWKCCSVWCCCFSIRLLFLA